MKNDYYNANNIKFVDYKDIDTLKKFVNPNGRILGRKRTGLSAKNQRMTSVSIKHARFMGLLPFIAN